MNLDSIKRRLEIADNLKPTDAEMKEYAELSVEGGVWSEAKWLVDRVHALEKQLAHLRKEKITTLLLSGFSQFQVDLIMAGYDSELKQAGEVGNE